MKYLLVLILSVSLFADEAAAPPAAAAMNGNKSVILIEAKARASDLVQAFDLLKKDKSTFKINIRTASGLLILNAMELTSSVSGTLVFLKILSNQGARYQVIPTEEIMEISYSP